MLRAPASVVCWHYAITWRFCIVSCSWATSKSVASWQRNIMFYSLEGRSMWSIIWMLLFLTWSYCRVERAQSLHLCSKATHSIDPLFWRQWTSSSCLDSTHWSLLFRTSSFWWYASQPAIPLSSLGIHIQSIWQRPLMLLHRVKMFSTSLGQLQSLVFVQQRLYGR